MNTHYITFQQHQVALQVGPPAVRRGIEQRFRAMLTEQATAVVARLQVAARGQGFALMLPQQRGEQTAATPLDMVAQVEHESIVQFIRAFPDLCWLHAGAVAQDGRAVVIAGGWGRGKSTLVTSLARHGWLYLSDDLAPISGATAEVLPFPLTPRVRQSVGATLARRQVPDLPRIDVTLSPAQIRHTAVTIGAFVFPAYRPGAAAQLCPVSPAQATLRLTRHCLNVMRHRETAVATFVHLTQTIPAYELTYRNGAEAACVVAAALATAEVTTKPAHC